MMRKAWKKVNQGDTGDFESSFEDTIEEDNKKNTTNGKASGYPTINFKKVDILIPNIDGKIHDNGYMNMITV